MWVVTTTWGAVRDGWVVVRRRFQICLLGGSPGEILPRIWEVFLLSSHIFDSEGLELATGLQPPWRNDRTRIVIDQLLMGLDIETRLSVLVFFFVIFSYSCKWPVARTVERGIISIHFSIRNRQTLLRLGFAPGRYSKFRPVASLHYLSLAVHVSGKWMGTDVVGRILVQGSGRSFLGPKSLHTTVCQRRTSKVCCMSRHYHRSPCSQRTALGTEMILSTQLALLSSQVPLGKRFEGLPC